MIIRKQLMAINSEFEYPPFTLSEDILYTLVVLPSLTREGQRTFSNILKYIQKILNLYYIILNNNIVRNMDTDCLEQIRISRHEHSVFGVKGSKEMAELLKNVNDKGFKYKTKGGRSDPESTTKIRRRSYQILIN